MKGGNGVFGPDSSNAQTWAELHERAFRRLGGTPKTVVYDYVTRHIIGVLCPLALCARVQTRDFASCRFF